MSGSDAPIEEPTFGLWYDFRNPDPHRPFSRFYAEVLDQIAWAESLGLGSVWLTEHHFCDDGYSPSPFVLAAAIGQRTTSMRIGTNLIVSPLHDPIRLAEDAATLSLLSGGRFDLGVGQGYWEREFAAFGKKVVNRPSLLEEGVAVIAEDPERTWARIGEYALYQLNEYISWGAFGPPDEIPRFPDAQSILDAGAFRLWDAATAVTELTALLRGCPQIRDVHFWAQLPGESVESGSERIEYLATQVMPQVRAALSR